MASPVVLSLPNGTAVAEKRNVSACLEGLNFSKFKEKMRAKVAVAVAKNSAGADGADGHAQNDRIFKVRTGARCSCLGVAFF